MAISQYDFIYSAQLVRFLEQIVRAFSGFSYQTGTVAGQPPQTVLVPCRIASSNRMVANLLSNLSENTLLSVPLITVYQTGLRGRREDLQNPIYVDTRQAFERNIRPDGSYGPDRGNAYTVDRLMPLPFSMDVQVDIWTSNLQQKYMLIEQILPAIYPQFEIQNSSNALDWTAVTLCMVDDDFTFSSRTIPVGTNDEIDVMTIQLKLPIWLSAPAKVKRISRIEQVVANVSQGELDPAIDALTIEAPLGQIIVTPKDACIAVNGATITLLTAKYGTLTTNGDLPSWSNLIDRYGTLLPTQSKIKLFIDGSIAGGFVTGVLQYGAESNQLLWTVDAVTLPVNTLSPIDGVVDPLRSFPGDGLTPAIDGQRYLLINDIGTMASTVAWGTLAAYTNDIIEYAAGANAWIVSFAAATATPGQYVLNQFTGRQLRWTGSMWTMSIDGSYGPGYWRLGLTPALAQGTATLDIS